jgi:hypothetical protein
MCWFRDRTCPDALARYRDIPAATRYRSLDLGEHADRARTDHDLADWVDDVSNFDLTPGEADVKRPSPAGLTAGNAQGLWIGA